MFNFRPKIPQITVDEVKKVIEERGQIVLLDVRTPEEYSHGKIKGSINLPADDIAGKIGELFPDKNTLIYVYCRSGLRSTFAAITMLKLGYANVYNITNGLLAWQTKRYPLEY